MAKAKKKRASTYAKKLVLPEGMTFDDVIKLSVGTVPEPSKKKKEVAAKK